MKRKLLQLTDRELCAYAVGHPSWQIEREIARRFRGTRWFALYCDFADQEDGNTCCSMLGEVARGESDPRD